MIVYRSVESVLNLAPICTGGYGRPCYLRGSNRKKNSVGKEGCGREWGLYPTVDKNNPANQLRLVILPLIVIYDQFQ